MLLVQMTKKMCLSKECAMQPRKNLILLLLFIFYIQAKASFLLVPMDTSQSNHLKAYGITFFSLQNGVKVQWLLNYRGGSFLLENQDFLKKELIIRGISYDELSLDKAAEILSEIESPSKNQTAVLLEKAPKIAVYSPKSNQPWDDAVTLVLQYAEIPYDIIYDKEVLEDKLLLYEWLQLHHEDFTGQ